MSTARLLIGDVFEELATLPDASVHFLCCSPPFLALRSYLPPGHPLKAKEIGSEPDPATFIDVLLALTAEWGRVLAPWGSIAVELGDTYAGSGGAGGDWSDSPATTKARVVGGSNGGPPRRDVGPTWPLAKSLCGIPDAYSLSLQYGFNVLRGPDHPSPAGRWRVRNRIVWARPNPPVGSLGGRAVKDENGEKIGKEGGDRFRTATSIITVATRSDHAWFDLDAVRGEVSEWTKSYADKYPTTTVEKGQQYKNKTAGATTAFIKDGINQQGAPPLDFAVEDGSTIDGWAMWVMSPGGYKGAHYAVYPTELPKRLIEAMCPRHVCTVCGEARRRVTAPTEAYDAKLGASIFNGDRDHEGRRAGQPKGDHITSAETTTLGWTDCGHGDNWTPGVVLDPFSGSGTTLAAATGLGRDAIGIDIDERNVDLHRERVGMFLSVEEGVA